jgi:hypothetical protein
MPRGTFDTPGFDVGSDVGVSATVGPMSTLPGMRGVDIKGCPKQVASIAARNAIPGDGLARTDVLQMRQEGMRCWVQDRGDGNPAEYQLVGGVDDSNWVDVTLPSGIGSKARNTDTDAVLVGHILCQSPTVAQAVRLTSIAADDARSRPVGVATSAQPTPGSSVDLQTSTGEPVQVRLVAALGLGGQLGQEIILGDVNGEGTLPGAASSPATGELVQRVGILLDTLTYDGGADRLVLVQLDLAGTRRIET